MTLFAPAKSQKKRVNVFFQKPSYPWCLLFDHQAMLFAFKGKSQGVVMSLYQKRNLSSVAASVQRWRQSHFWGVTSCWHNMGGNTKKAWHEKEFHSGCVGIWHQK